YGDSGEDLAKRDPNKVTPRPHVFRTAQEAELSYDNGIVRLHNLAMLQRGRGAHVFTPVGRILFTDRIERSLLETLGDDYKPGEFQFVNKTLTKRDVNDLAEQLVVRCGAAPAAR